MILSYTHRSCIAQPSSEKLFLQWMGANTETPSQTMCRVCEILEHLALYGMSPSNPSYQSSGNPEKEETEKNVRASGDRRHQENSPLNQHEESSYEIINIEALCTGPA